MKNLFLLLTTSFLCFSCSSKPVKGEESASWFSPAEWFGMPKNYSAHGDSVGHMIDVVTWFMLALFVGWSIFFFYCLVRFRKKDQPEAEYHGVKSHLSTHLEIGVIVVEAVLLLGFAFPMWSERTDTYDQIVEEENPVRVRAIGFQFGWKFHYAGADGKFGYIDLTTLREPGDPGVDYTSGHGTDDFVMGELIIPVDRPCILQVTSTDVIHNFSIIPMRIQQDAIPGKDIPMWFTPIAELETSVVCGQLCGSGHGNMLGTMKVISQKDFDKFLKDNSAKAHKKNSVKAAELTKN